MGCPKTFAQYCNATLEYCNATLDMICHIAAKHINTDIVTKLLFYEHQIQNNIQSNRNGDVEISSLYPCTVFE